MDNDSILYNLVNNAAVPSETNNRFEEFEKKAILIGAFFAPFGLPHMELGFSYILLIDGFYKIDLNYLEAYHLSFFNYALPDIFF